MGYDIGFAPTEEMMGKYNIPLLGFNRIPELKLSLTAYCLTKQEIGKKFYEILSINLSYLQSLIESETKVNAYEQWKNEKEVWWRGWQYSQPAQFTKKDNLEGTLKSLYILATVVETPDWINHSENFYFKEEEIENTIEGFIDSVRELTIHEIIEDLKENKAEEIGDNKISEENVD